MATHGIYIEATSVAQKASGARRFKGVVTRVKVDQPVALIVKGIVFYLFDDLFGCSNRRIAHHAPELGFDAKNSFFHFQRYSRSKGSNSFSESKRKWLSRCTSRSSTAASTMPVFSSSRRNALSESASSIKRNRSAPSSSSSRAV